MAADTDTARAQPGARGDHELLPYHVDSGHHLRHRMLHLEPPVDLQEIGVPVLIHEVFHGSKALEPDGADDHLGPFPEVVAGFGVDIGDGGLFDDLLVAPLDGAFPVAQHLDSALPVREDLHLQVPGAGKIVLHVHLVAAEGRVRFAADAGKLLAELVFVIGDLHPPAAASIERFEDHRHPELPGHGNDLIDIGDHAVGAGDGGNVQRLDNLLGPRLVADGPQCRAGRSDEGDAVLLAQGGEAGVFRQETVARMDGVRLPHKGRTDDGLDIQVALRRLRRTDLDRLVGVRQILHVPVGLGIHHNGFQPHLSGRSEHPHNDLAPVRNQKPFHTARLYASLEEQVKIHMTRKVSGSHPGSSSCRDSTRGDREASGTARKRKGLVLRAAKRYDEVLSNEMDSNSEWAKTVMKGEIRENIRAVHLCCLHRAPVARHGMALR